MLSVFDHRELQAITLAMKAADRDLKREINKATRDTMNPVWRDLVQSRLAHTESLSRKVLGGGVRIAAGNPPQAMAAQSKRKVGDGRITPQTDYGPWEFGAPNRNLFSRYERKNRKTGGHHTVERRTMRHLPHRHQKGRVVYPAFADIAPRMVSLWVQLVMKKYFDAAEGKR